MTMRMCPLRGKSLRLIWQLKETRQCVRDIQQQFIQLANNEDAAATRLQADLEEARTWATLARVSTDKVKKDTKELKKEMTESNDEIKDVFRVHRDLIK